MPRSIGPDDDEPPRFSESPLDELFVQGATIHELSAKEREAAAREREKRQKQEAKDRAKQIKHAKRVLGGDRDSGFGGGGDYDKRTALIGFGVMLALAVVASVTIFA